MASVGSVGEGFELIRAVLAYDPDILAPLKFSHGKNLGANSHSPLMTSNILRFSCCYKNHAIACSMVIGCVC